MTKLNQNKLADTTSNKIQKFWNGRALCNITLEALFDQYKDAEGKIHCIYKNIDTTNGFEYWGKMNTSKLSYFKKYFGSGTLLRYMAQQNGVENFEQHIIAFYDTDAETNDAEEQIVNEQYLSVANTYNLSVGGLHHFSNSKRAFYDTKTDRTFKCNAAALDRLLNSFTTFTTGLSPQDILNSHWTKSTCSKIAESNKNINLSRVNNTTHQYEEVNVQLSDLMQYLNLGWEIKSTKLWVHLPGQTIYRRGQNYKQISSHTKNVMKYILEGFVPGRPPRYKGAIIDKAWRHRKNKNIAISA